MIKNNTVSVAMYIAVIVLTNHNHFTKCYKTCTLFERMFYLQYLHNTIIMQIYFKNLFKETIFKVFSLDILLVYYAHDFCSHHKTK